MDLKYNELYEKYRILERENKRLKDEIILLRKALTKEEVETYNSIDFTIIKESDTDQNSNIVTINSSSTTTETSEREGEFSICR